MRLLFVCLIAASLIWHGLLKPRRNRVRIRENRYAKAVIPTKFIIFLSALLVVVGGFESRWQYLQWEASAALQEVTGNDSAILSCQRLSESWIDMDSASIGGKVYGDNINVAHLKYKQCAELFWWMQSWDKSNPSNEQAAAVHVLTHEGIHTTGEFNEAVTECTAIQRDSLMATSLGATEETGLLLQKKYFDNVYPRVPSKYLLEGCSIDPQYDSLLTSGEPTEG